MEARANEVQSKPQETYSVISFKACELPNNYLGIVLSRWLKSLRHGKTGNDYFRLIDKDHYYENYEAYLHRLLNKTTTTVKIAVLTNDHDVVFGWSMIEGKHLHYIHVHEDYRKKGIGKSLIPKEIDTITHATKSWLDIWNKYPHIKLKPF